MFQVVGVSQTSKNIADRQVFCVLFLYKYALL